MQINLLIIPPISAAEVMKVLINMVFLENVKMMRIIPYPPSFNNKPARIIDPATGASTWALGNQRCIPYMGVLIKKARSIKIHHKFLVRFPVRNKFDGIVRLRCPFVLKIYKMLIKNGSAPITV